MNGDYMGTDDAATAEVCDEKCKMLLAREPDRMSLKEYAPAEFKKLAPKCCGGKGRL